MEQPFVTCVMPTKNRKRFVAESIRRFLAQDYPEHAELIVLEDGEEDCWDIAREYVLRRREEPLRSVRYERFEGSLGAKLNFGARESYGGEIIANWDDDDWYAPNRISAQVAHMQLTGRPVVALASMLFYREGDAEGWEYHGNSWYGGGASHMYRRDWALAHPHPNVSVAEDVAYMELAHSQGDLSTISGLDVMVARDHEANTCPRERGGFDLHGIHFHGSDNWREVPLARIQAVIGR